MSRRCLVLALLVLLAACGSPQATPFARDDGARATRIAEDAGVALALTATATAASATQTARAQPTATPAPTNTPTATATAVPSPTAKATAVSTRTATPRPTPTPPPAATAGQVLLDEDLSQPGGSWPGNGVPCGAADRTSCHDPQGLRITVPMPGRWAGARSPRLAALADSAVDLDVTVLAATGPTGGGYGVLCRYQDGDNYYVLRVWTDGRYSIYKTVRGVEYRIAGSGETASPAIAPGAAANHLHAECAGTTFVLAVNGQELLRAEDDEPALPAGETVLYACTCRGGTIDLVVTHATVRVPDAAGLPAAPSSPPPAAPAATATPTGNQGAAAGASQRYRDPAGRFSFDVPAGWTKEASFSGESIVAFVAPAAEAGFRANFNVILTDVPDAPGLTVEQLARQADAQMQQTFKDYTPLALEPLQVGGQPAYRLLYRVTMGSVALQQEQLYLLDGTTAHILTFTAQPDTFAQYAATFEAIAASYRLGP
jgi:hypothetical protein